MWNKRESAWHKWELNKHLWLLKNELNTLKNEKVSEIEAQIQDIKKYYEQLKISNPSIESEINEMVEELKWYNEKYLEIEVYHKEIFDHSEDTIGIKGKIHEFEVMIESYKEDLLFWKDWKKSIKRKIEEKYDEIREYHNSIFWKKESKDEEWNIIPWIVWFKKELEVLKEENETEFSTLKEKIESLLPWATSAWLSTAYKDMKNSFIFPTWFWSICFFGSLAIIVAWWKDIDVWNDLEETMLNFFPHFTYILPLIWIAYFSSKQQSQNNRLQQEYAHKESLAKSFEGYKKQIDNLWEDDKSKEIKRLLIQSMVSMTSDNPSDTLDRNHWTNPPFWEYVFWSNDKKWKQ